MDGDKWVVKPDYGYENPKKLVNTAIMWWCGGTFAFLFMNRFGGIVFILIGFLTYRHAARIGERNEARLFFFHCQYETVRYALQHWKLTHYGKEIPVEKIAWWIDNGWGRWENPDDFFALCNKPGLEVGMIREGKYSYLRPSTRKAG